MLMEVIDVTHFKGFCSSLLQFTSSQEVFCEIDFLKNFAKLTRKHLFQSKEVSQSIFFNNIVAVSLQPYQKRDSNTGVSLYILQKI